MRKSLLKTVLERLVPYRDMARDFLIILRECREEDQEFIDGLCNEIVKGIREIKSKENLRKISNEIKKIRKEEEAELGKSKRDLEELENLIDNIK